MERRRKHKRKRLLKSLLVFFGIFSLVLLVGSIGILHYSKVNGKKSAAFTNENEKVADIEVVQKDKNDVKEADDKNGEVESIDKMHKQDAREHTTINEDKVTISENQSPVEKIIDSYEEKQFYIVPKKYGEVELVFGGDVCFYDDFRLMGAYRERNGDIKKCISKDLLTQMHEADIFILNNEFTYSDRGAPLVEKAFTFRSKPENVKILKDMGVDIVGLANNHVWDYGEEALLDTMTILEEAGMPYIGAGKNLEEARMPAYFNCGDFTVAYVNATQIERNESPDTRGATTESPGTFRCFNEMELSNLQATIKEAKQKADFVVVYIHWGTENTTEPDWAQNYQAPLIAKAGADLIIGNHTHCLQGIDYFENTPVIYSVGNFWFNSKELDTCLVKAVVSKDGLKNFQFIPAKQQNCTTSLLHDAEKIRVLEFMRTLSPNVVIDEEGYVRRKEAVE